MCKGGKIVFKPHIIAAGYISVTTEPGAEGEKNTIFFLPLERSEPSKSVLMCMCQRLVQHLFIQRNTIGLFCLIICLFCAPCHKQHFDDDSRVLLKGNFIFYFSTPHDIYKRT